MEKTLLYQYKLIKISKRVLFHFCESLNIPLKNILNNKEITVSALKIFTHLITHEFHHKGQILSMGRHLGYTPVETGIIYQKFNRDVVDAFQ